MEHNEKDKVIWLYRNHYRALFNYGIKIIRDENVVKDCIQDCFFDLLSNPRKLRKAKNIKNYLLGMMRNLILKEISVSHKDKDLTAIASFDFSIEDSLIEGERKKINLQKLKMAISKLTPKQKEILYLRFYEKLSYQEIEKITATNYQSIRNLLSKAIKNLRESMLLLLLPTLSWLYKT